MELEQKVKLLQTFYAAVLADSVLRMGREGILEKVTSEKKLEQLKNGGARASQLQITKPEEVFEKASEIFGCANWKVESSFEGFAAEATHCMLCALSKKMGAQCPCNIYCLDAMEGMISGLDPDLCFNVEETLWCSSKCKVNIIKK